MDRNPLRIEFRLNTNLHIQFCIYNLRIHFSHSSRTEVDTVILHLVLAGHRVFWTGAQS